MKEMVATAQKFSLDAPGVQAWVQDNPVGTPGIPSEPLRISDHTIEVTATGCPSTFRTSQEPVAAASDIKTPVSIGRQPSLTSILRNFISGWHGGSMT